MADTENSDHSERNLRETSKNGTVGNDRAQRTHALYRLAQGSQQTTPPTSASRAVIAGRRYPSRNVVRWGVAGLALLAVAVIIGLIAHAVAARPTGHASVTVAKPVVIIPQVDRLNCPVDVAWSPDGAKVAVEGYEQACPNINPALGATSGLVNIYSATTGQLLIHFQLDQAILNGHGVTLGSTPAGAGANSGFTPYIGYTGMAWEPDGQHIALSFIVERQQLAIPPPTLSGNRTPPHAIQTVAGVLLVDSSGGSSRVWSAPYTIQQTALQPSQEWDVTSGKLVSGALILPPTLGYTWGTNGALSPRTTLTTTPSSQADTPPASGAIGNPIGGQTFTIWQPTDASAARRQTSAGGPIPNLYLSYAYFSIWSPDGRYFITPSYHGGWSAPAGVITQATLQEAGVSATPALPPAGPALQRVYAPGSLDIFLAWSPDGKRLAAVAPTGGASDSMNVSDGATGQPLKSLITATLDPTLAQETANSTGVVSEASVFLRWSLDGSHLLLWDAGVGTLTIWGPRQLGT